MNSIVQRAPLEVDENTLAIQAHHVGRRAPKICFLHGRKSFVREIPLDEQIPSQEIKSLMGSFEELPLKRLSARSATASSSAGRVWSWFRVCGVESSAAAAAGHLSSRTT